MSGWRQGVMPCAKPEGFTFTLVKTVWTLPMGKRAATAQTIFTWRSHKLPIYTEPLFNTVGGCTKCKYSNVAHVGSNTRLV